MHKNFENMGIYDLRNYARSMGVNSPTTLKRDELISKINEIINGKQPEPKKNNKGRPPRHKNDENIMLDLILPDNLFQTSNEDRYKELENFSSYSSLKDVLSEHNSVSQTNVLFKGFYKEYSNEFSFVCFKGYLTDYYKENTIVLKELAVKYSLKDGDYVEGVANYYAEKGIMLACDITFINDIDVKNLNAREDIENILPCYATTKIKIPNEINYKLIDKISPITYGSRTIINIQNQNMKNEFMITFLDNLSIRNNLRTLFISIDDTPEDIGLIMFHCKDVEVCRLSALQTRAQYFEKVFTFITNCIRRLESHQDIAIVLNNTSKFIKAFAENLIITQNINQSSGNIVAVNKLKDIFNMSRNISDGSLTMVFVDAPEDLTESANCFINLMEKPYDKTNVFYDIKNSYNKNIEKILNEKDFELLNKFKENFDCKKAKELIENFLN